MSVDMPLPTSGIDILDRPVSPSEKAKYVREIFDQIAPAYDFLNDVLSAGVHHRWRALATRCAVLSPGNAVLDLCTGTGAWIGSLRTAVGDTGQVVGLDFSKPMLLKGGPRFSEHRAITVQGDASAIPFGSNTFDAVTIAFGLRNLGDRAQALREMFRVTAPGGRIVVLEFAEPHRGVFWSFYRLYSRYVMPAIGGAMSGRADAYTYLPQSVTRFPSRIGLAHLMADCGWTDVRWIDMTFGLVAIHVGVKPL